MRGGPAAISADLVPGCILRLAFASSVLCSIVGPSLELLTDGDLGPICISVGGGGLGSLGELGGSSIVGIDKSASVSSAVGHQERMRFFSGKLGLKLSKEALKRAPSRPPAALKMGQGFDEAANCLVWNRQLLFAKFPPIFFNMDLDEEEVPPLLVDVKAKDNETEQEPNIRVPITIVTGKSHLPASEFRF
jgi:hypothetical protein